MDYSPENISRLLRELNEVGAALSAEKDHHRLLELILIKAMEMTNSDGGTLYTRTGDQCLQFEILYTRSLGIHKGGSSPDRITFQPISLYDDNGEPNNNMVVAAAVNEDRTVVIPDAYTCQQFDFSGTRSFDKKMGYRSTSFLTVPMKNHENDIIGVLQLINAMKKNSSEITSFSFLDQQLVESMASQAAVTITKKNLIDGQRNLFDAFIQLIADAIDEKSPYTASHCQRVPVITSMLVDAVNRIDKGPLSHFSMTEEEKYELEVAAWLHDCGKITTPEYIVDKSTKLETIFDRIHLTDTRFEILKRDAIIACLQEQLRQLNPAEDAEKRVNSNQSLKEKLDNLKQEREDIRRFNIGGESMDKADLSRIQQIAARTYIDLDNKTVNLLNEEEQKNLAIERGTLTMEEREIINNHVSVTIKMLESLPYPKHLVNVPEYAGGHHEKIDGTGYPNQLHGDQMSLQAKMLAIADIFEALTTGDRPYKKAMTLSQSLCILGRMKMENHIDGDLFDVFMHEKIYLDYAHQYLAAHQIDEIDYDDIPGYNPLH